MLLLQCCWLLLSLTCLAVQFPCHWGAPTCHSAPGTILPPILTFLQELKAKEQIAQLKLEISNLTKLLEQGAAVGLAEVGARMGG